MTYTVQPGDTLTGIAVRFLGTVSASATLFQINRSVIRSGSPSTLSPGEQLVIPEQMISASLAKRRSSGDPDLVVLVVNGVEYVGWESVKIVRSMSTASASFEVSLFDKWEVGEEPWPIFLDDEVKVFIGADQLIDGYVDKVGLTIDGVSRGMHVGGRDRTADLVDCSAMNRPGTWVNKTLEDIASDIARPFGVVVVAGVDTGPVIPVFKLLPGEKGLESISRAAIAKNLLVTSGFSGRLALTRSGELRAVDSLVEGVNLLSGEVDLDSADRFSAYIVEGQYSGQGANGMKGVYNDAGVPRYRPMHIHADQKASQEYLNGRAEWEARARAAKAETGTVKVRGWRQSDGTLHQTNRLVSCMAPSLGLSEQLLIADVTYELSSSAGTVSTLKLVRPDAFLAAEELQATKDLARAQRIARRGQRGGSGRTTGRGVSGAEVQAELDSLKPIIRGNDF